MMRFIRRVAGIAAVAALAAAGPSAAGLRVFVANSGQDTVSVIDGDTDKEIRAIQVGATPQGLALRNAPALLAVSNSRGNSVTLIDPTTLAIVNPAIPVGRYPVGVEFSADGALLFVTSLGENAVSILDVATEKLVGDSIAVGGPPLRIRRSPDGHYLFAILSTDKGGVAVIDTQRRTLAQTIATGHYPTDLAVSPDGSRLFVAAFKSDALTEIDLKTLQPIGTYDFSAGNGILIHPTKPLLYSMNSFENEVWIYDYKTHEQAGSVPVGQNPIYSAITPDGHFLYVVNGSDGNVMKVDTETKETLGRIAVGNEPIDAVVFDAGRTWGIPLSALAGTAGALIGIVSVFAIAMRRRQKPRVSPSPT